MALSFRGRVAAWAVGLSTAVIAGTIAAYLAWESRIAVEVGANTLMAIVIGGPALIALREALA